MTAPLVSAAEAAEHLGVTVQTLATWRWKKLGPPYRKVGRGVRYDLTEVDQWTRRDRDAPEVSA